MVQRLWKSVQRILRYFGSERSSPVQNKIGCHGNVPCGIGKTGPDYEDSRKYLPFGVKSVKIGPVDTEMALLIVKKKKKLRWVKYIARSAGLPSGLNKGATPCQSSKWGPIFVHWMECCCCCCFKVESDCRLGRGCQNGLKGTNIYKVDYVMCPPHWLCPCVWLLYPSSLYLHVSATA